jgi:hypothetical protein
VRVFHVFVAALLIAAAASCSGSPSSTAPSPTPTPTPAAPRLTAPAPESPADSEQLATLRPTLTVRNGASDQAGTRTYDFQISDRTDFAVTRASFVGSYSIIVNKTAIPEGSGTTSYAVETELQPTTRLYWRTRVVQGSTASEWSEARSFKTRLVGYNRPGELYDPLIFGETVGAPVGSTMFVAGRGIRINDLNSYVRYQLAQTIPNGEFSVEVEGLHANGPGAKLKVMSMMDGTGNLFTSKYLLHAMYRGIDGNPNNCIAFKALFGTEDFKFEPDLAKRNASVMSLNPARAYYWKITWSNEFRLVVQDGMGGATLYDYGLPSRGSTYAPTPHYAYLGANNGPYGEETGSWAGATYRNVWIGNRPRPVSLGSALRPD